MVIRVISVKMGMLILEIGIVVLYFPLAVWDNFIILVWRMNYVHPFHLLDQSLHL